MSDNGVNECEVALMVSRRLSNKEIGRELGISDGTVKIHLHNIFLSPGAKKRSHIVFLLRRAA
jgi:DNA-binding CsgD family transcriptional regulator